MIIAFSEYVAEGMKNTDACGSVDGQGGVCVFKGEVRESTSNEKS